MRYILLLLLVSCGVTSKQGSNSNKQKIERNYFNDSIVAIEKFYKNSQLDSLKTYYKSGILNEVFYYEKGTYHGTCKKYSRTGVHTVSWKFKKGKLLERIDHHFDINSKNKKKRTKTHKLLLETNNILKHQPETANLIYKRAYYRYMLEEHTLALNAFLELEKYILRTTTITNQHDPKFVSSIYDAIGSIYSTYEMEEKSLHYKYKAVKAAPTQNRLYYNLGSDLIMVNSYRLGISFLNKTLEMAPNHSFAHWALGIAYSDIGQYQKAMKHINIAFQKEKGLYKYGLGIAERDVRTTRGLIYHKLGDSENAIQDLNEALEINPNNSYAMRNLGIVYADLKQYDLACNYFKKSKELHYIKSHDSKDIETYAEAACAQQPIVLENAFSMTTPYANQNPASFLLKIKNYAFENFAYSIHSYESKQVQKGISEGTEIQIYKLQPGIYTLKIEHPEFPTSIRFIKI